MRVTAEQPHFDDRVTVGRWTYGLQRKTFRLWRPDERIIIGSFCSFAQEVAVFGGGAHYESVTTYPLWALMIDPGGAHEPGPASAPTVIGSDVWVGTRAMILAGVTVGHGAIVGAGAVVTRDVPPYAVVAGCPARVIRTRFPDDIVERLLAVAWWEWDDETIRARGELFHDVEEFLDVAERQTESEALEQIPAPPRHESAGDELDQLRDELLGLHVPEPRRAIMRRNGTIKEVPLEDPHSRRHGLDWPVEGVTMVGQLRLDNVRACIESVLREDVPGDLIETGVWRGGTTIMMRAVLAAHGVTDRKVWVADSFAGLPPPDPEAYPADEGDELHTHSYLAVPQGEVRRNFKRLGLLDEQVRFLPGWFKDTLPALSRRRFAVVRLDGDMYESTIVALEHLYPRLSPGGYLIVDDYGAIRACRQAVEDYRSAHGIDERIWTIDWTGVFWRKQREPVTSRGAGSRRG